MRDEARLRSLAELVVEADAWPTLRGWIHDASDATPLTLSPDMAAQVLVALQVTTRSILGSLVWQTGGIDIGSWLRHLGAGELWTWNSSLGGRPLDPPLEGALIVARDAVGGVFAINSGGLQGEVGGMCYFAPDALAWMELEMGHADFVRWSLSSQIDQFYADLKWTGWQSEVAAMTADQVMSFYPPLGFESTPLDERYRRPVPEREMWTFLQDLAKQTAGLPPGAPIRFAAE